MFLNKNCPGCGGGEGNQSCKIARCSMEHNGAQYCFQCSEYPCEKYDHIDDMLMYLGELYQTDERFVEYINRFATWNVAEFLVKQLKSIAVIANKLLYLSSGKKEKLCWAAPILHSYTFCWRRLCFQSRRSAALILCLCFIKCIFLIKKRIA